MDTGNYTFLCRTKTGFGQHGLDHLPFDLAGMGAQKPFVLQDAAAADQDASAPLIRAFKESNMTLGICPPMDSDGEPGMDTLKTCFQTFTNKGFDSIIALGTGPVTDLAKALNLAVSFGPDALKKKMDTAPGQLKPLAWLPTGVGTGLETSCRACFDSQEYAFPALAPDLAVVDPALMGKDSIDRVVNSSLTCLALCCETIGLSHNPPASAYASCGIELVMAHLLPLLEQTLPATSIARGNKADREHQAALVHASLISGYLLANTLPRISYPLGHAIAKAAPVSPGRAMAVVLPAALDILCNNRSQLADLLLPLAGQDKFSIIPPRQQPNAAIQRIQECLNQLYRVSLGRFPRLLADIGMNKTDVEAVFDTLKNSPADDLNGVDPDQIQMVLARSLDGNTGNPDERHS